MTAPETGLALLAPVRRVAGGIMRACDRTAWLGWGSTAVVAGVLLYWTWPTSLTSGILIGLLALILSLPGLIIFLLGRSLTVLAELPDRLLEGVRESSVPALALSGGPVRSVWRFVRYLYGARDRLWALKDELAAAGALVRFASPFVLAVILAAAGAVAAQIPLAGLLLLLAVLF